MATTFTIAGNIMAHRDDHINHIVILYCCLYCQILLTAADTPESHRFHCDFGDKAGKGSTAPSAPNSIAYRYNLYCICLYSHSNCEDAPQRLHYSCNQYRDKCSHINRPLIGVQSCKCKSIAYIFFFPTFNQDYQPNALPSPENSNAHVISVIIDITSDLQKYMYKSMHCCIHVIASNQDINSTAEI